MASTSADLPEVVTSRCRYSYSERRIISHFSTETEEKNAQLDWLNDIDYDDESTGNGRWKQSAVDEIVEGTFLSKLGGLHIFPRSVLSPIEWNELGFTVIDSAPVRDRHTVFDGPEISLRSSVQEKAVKALLENKGGILELAPGKGKTVMSLATAQIWGEPTLVFVHNGSLYEQWIDRISEHYHCSTSEIGRVQGPFKTWVWSNKGICVAMLQSFISELEADRVPPEFFERFGTVIWDEVHHAKAETYSRTLPLFSSKRIGLSATPNLKGKEAIYFAHIGRPVYTDLTFDVTPTYKLHTFTVPEWKEVPKKHALAYSKLLDSAFYRAKERVANGVRSISHGYLDQVIDRVLTPLRDAGRKVIVIAPRVSAGAYIKAKMNDVGEINGNVHSTYRAKILSSHDITVVTRSIGEEGIDYPPLTDTVYLVPVGRNGSNSLRQGAGRLGRLSPGKTEACVHICCPEDDYAKSLQSANARLLAEMGIYPHGSSANRSASGDFKKPAKRDSRGLAPSVMAFLKNQGGK